MDEEELLNKIDLMFQEYIKPIKDYISIQKAIKDFGISDKSQSKRPRQDTDKELIGDFTIGKKGCNKCGGKITWDNYNETDHRFPDHVDDDGNLIDCPEYKM